MIRVIYFDLGGVLFENGTKNAIEFLERTFSIDQKTLMQIFYGPLSWELRAGKIESKAYWDRMGQEHPSVCNTLDLKDIWYSCFQLNTAVWEVVKDLSKEVFLGIFSGNIEDRVEYLEDKYEFSHLFTYQVYSYAYGLNKLEEKLYRIALNKCNCDPKEVLFIDDGQDCLDIAKALGASTLLYDGDLQLGLENYGIRLSTY